MGVGSSGRRGATVEAGIRVGTLTVAASEGVSSGVRVGEGRAAVGVGEL